MQATLQLTVRRFTRPLRFGLVGVSGIVVNSAILWALVQRLHVAIPLASTIATEVAIVSNFLLNDRWTFRAAGAQRSPIARFVRFNGVALGGMAITAVILTMLTHYARLDLLIANLGAVGAATFWNYVINSRWTWGRATTDHRPLTIDTDQETSRPGDKGRCEIDRPNSLAPNLPVSQSEWWLEAAGYELLPEREEAVLL